MARMRQNTMNLKVIEAILYTPFILLGSTKGTRRSAARKWVNLFRYVCK